MRAVSIIAVLLLIGGFLAIPANGDSSVSEGQVTFEFWPDDSDWDYCGDQMTVEVSYWSDYESGYEQMYFDSSQMYFYKTVSLQRGYCEFYYSVCGTPLSDMDRYEDWIMPEPDRFVDDGVGGYNAWVQVY